MKSARLKGKESPQANPQDPPYTYSLRLGTEQGVSDIDAQKDLIRDASNQDSGHLVSQQTSSMGSVGTSLPRYRIENARPASAAQKDQRDRHRQEVLTGRALRGSKKTER